MNTIKKNSEFFNNLIAALFYSQYSRDLLIGKRLNDTYNDLLKNGIQNNTLTIDNYDKINDIKIDNKVLNFLKKKKKFLNAFLLPKLIKSISEKISCVSFERYNEINYISLSEYLTITNRYFLNDELKLLQPKKQEIRKELIKDPDYITINKWFDKDPLQIPSILTEIDKDIDDKYDKFKVDEYNIRITINDYIQDTIEYNGIIYKLDSLIINTYNNNKDPIVCLTDNDYRKIYFGTNTSKCNLFKFDWVDVDDNDFVIYSKFPCNVFTDNISEINEKELSLFNITKCNHTLIYIKTNIKDKQVDTKEQDEIKKIKDIIIKIDKNQDYNNIKKLLQEYNKYLTIFDDKLTFKDKIAKIDEIDEIIKKLCEDKKKKGGAGRKKKSQKTESIKSQKTESIKSKEEEKKKEEEEKKKEEERTKIFEDRIKNLPNIIDKLNKKEEEKLKKEFATTLEIIKKTKEDEDKKKKEDEEKKKKEEEDKKKKEEEDKKKKEEEDKKKKEEEEKKKKEEEEKKKKEEEEKRKGNITSQQKQFQFDIIEKIIELLENYKNLLINSISKEPIISLLKKHFKDLPNNATIDKILDFISKLPRDDLNKKIDAMQQLLLAKIQEHKDTRRSKDNSTTLQPEIDDLKKQLQSLGDIQKALAETAKKNQIKLIDDLNLKLDSMQQELVSKLQIEKDSKVHNEIDHNIKEQLLLLKDIQLKLDKDVKSSSSSKKDSRENALLKVENTELKKQIAILEDIQLKCKRQQKEYKRCNKHNTLPYKYIKFKEDELLDAIRDKFKLQKQPNSKIIIDFIFNYFEKNNKVMNVYIIEKYMGDIYDVMKIFNKRYNIDTIDIKQFYRLLAAISIYAKYQDDIKKIFLK
jgi:hypothetical protein